MVNIFDKMESMDSEATRATVERHEVPNEEADMATGSTGLSVIEFKTAVVCITSLQKWNK
jgi:hypothetical protein